MVRHKADEILNAIVTELSGNTTCGFNVFRTRSQILPVDVLPAITVSQGEKSPTLLQSSVTDTTMQIYIDIFCQLKGNSADETLNFIAKDVYAILNRNLLSLSYVRDLLWTGDDTPFEQFDGDQPTATMRQSWQISFRHTDSSIETAA